jgi:hypothetical protein
MEHMMDLVLFVAVALVLSWLVAIAILSEKPQARVARALLASAGVVAASWVSSASAGVQEVGNASLVLTLLRSFA